MNQNKLSYLALLTTILIISSRADDPPLEGSPPLKPTNAPPAQAAVPAQPQTPSSTNKPPEPLKIPIYVVPKVHWVQTPMGIFPLIPERNWADLLSLFPNAEQTNLVIYSTK